MQTMEPPPSRIIRFPTAWEQKKVPLTSMSMTDRQPFGDRSSARDQNVAPALFTNIWMRPNFSSAWRTMFSTWS